MAKRNKPKTAPLSAVPQEEPMNEDYPRVLQPEEWDVGHFPALRTKFRDELGGLLSRQGVAIDGILKATKEYTETLEQYQKAVEQQALEDKRALISMGK